MASTPPSWFPRLARVGYAGKGLVYLLIGVLALATAIGQGGKTTGSSGALEWIASQSWGLFVLPLLALALCCYAVHRVVTSVEPYNNWLENQKSR